MRIVDTERVAGGWVISAVFIQRDHAKRRQEARRSGQDVDARPLTAVTSSRP